MALQHVAIIMDGNGRWAKQRGAARTAGHKEGLEVAKKTVKAVSDLHIPYVTLYVFSSENWKRTQSEVGFLMGLIEKHLLAELEFYRQNSIRIRQIGDRTQLPRTVQSAIEEAEKQTAHFTGTTVVLAINYGGQDEILRATKKFAAALLTANSFSGANGTGEHNKQEVLTSAQLRESFMRNLQTMTAENFSACLDTHDIPPVDLLIRTGGEKRLSNFLLYQAAYAELYFSPVLWPDWTAHDLQRAIDDFNKRNRRFGDAR